MSQSPFNPSDLPPDLAFVSLPKVLAQFHHLPEHVPIWASRADQAREKGYNFQEGARAMEELLEKAPQVPGSYLYKLFVRKWPLWMEVSPLMESNRVAEAIPKLVSILDMDPECPLTCFQLAFCFRATGEFEKSESFYQKALTLAPEAGWIYSNLGRTYQAMNQREKALEVFWKALDLLPGDLFVLEQLEEMGELYALPPDPKDPQTRRFVRKADYEKKMAQEAAKKKGYGPLLGLGWTLLSDRLWDLALSCFERAREERPEEAAPLMGLGLSHLHAGRPKEAERWFLEFLDQDPASVSAHLNLFKTYLALSDEDAAWEEIQTAVQLDPARLEAVDQLFLLLQESGRVEEGLERLRDLASMNPEAAAPLIVEGRYLTQKEDWNGAEKVLKEALRRSPDSEEALLLYTSGLGEHERYEEIVALLAPKAESLPLTLTVNLALAYQRLGRLEGGREVLGKFKDRPELSALDGERVERILRELEKGEE